MLAHQAHACNRCVSQGNNLRPQSPTGTLKLLAIEDATARRVLWSRSFRRRDPCPSKERADPETPTDSIAALQSGQSQEVEEAFRWSKVFHIGFGHGGYHSRGGEAPNAMASRLICRKDKNRSVECLLTETNTRAQAVRNNDHIDCCRNF